MTENEERDYDDPIKQPIGTHHDLYRIIAGNLVADHGFKDLLLTDSRKAFIHAFAQAGVEVEEKTLDQLVSNLNKFIEKQGNEKLIPSCEGYIYDPIHVAVV